MHKFAGRSHASITEEELDNLTDEEYQEYLQWRVNVNLAYMVAEGFVVTEIDPDTGEVLYKLAENAEV
jgi:hypothetical protein